MPSAKGLIKKLDKTLTKYDPNDRQVYKRVVTRTGGDALIGRTNSVLNADTLLAPQPMYTRLSRNVVGSSRYEEGIGGLGNEIAADYSVIISPTAMSLADFRDLNVTLVFKDASLNEEVFRITDFESASFKGVGVMYIVFVRSMKRP